MPKQKPTSRNLTLEQKSALTQHHLANPSKRHEALAQWIQQQFCLPKASDWSTISKILQDKERFILITLQDQSLKRARFLHHPELDNALANWVLQMEHRKIRINGDIIKEKGRQFAQALSITNPPAFSNGWLQSFKE